MESKITFGRWEMTALIINAISVQAFLNYPRGMVETAGTAGWMIPVYTTGLTALIFFVITRLYKGFEGKDILDIAQAAGGGFGRIITGLLLLVQIGFIVAIILREFGEDMKVIALTNSPISFVLFFFLGGMILAAYTGLESITRLMAIAVPLILFGLLIILFGASPNYDLSNLAPILGNGLPSIAGGITKVSAFSSLIALFILAPYIKTHKNFTRSGYWAILLSGIILLLSTVAYEAAFPYPAALESFIPIYSLARLINFGRFFQRVESVFVLVWAMSALLYLSVGFFLLLHILRKTFRLEYYKPLILPLAVILFTVSLLPPNLMDAVVLETKVFRNVAWVIPFGFTILLLLIARIRKGRKRKEAVHS